ncbi:hypothetical protein K0A96_00070 [Patescibacteria group bacterium]|nr:hypothetical protein [Patescibacteria group bacterium]
MPLDSLAKQIEDRYHPSYERLAGKREKWDDMEKMFLGILNDQISSRTKSQVVDPRLTNHLIDRSARVMSQMGSGKLKGISKNDIGSTILLNLILDKYVVPNANAQYDLLSKFRMVDMYSGLYGNFFAFVDWDVKANGYAGPDMWLLNIRDVFPQIGAQSLNSSDYIIIRSWKSLDWFKQIAKEKRDGFKNMSKIISKLEKIGGDSQNKDADKKTQRETNEYPGESAGKKEGMYSILSMYEKDRWVDYVESAREIMRDQKNPQDNGELPVVGKYSMPLLTDFFGFGDFERGMSLAKTGNSLWNLYMDAVKVSIFPPVLLNKDNIADASSIKYGASAKWLVRNNILNTAKTLNLAPQGVSTFNSAFSIVNASLLNIFGTTDTTITEKTDPGFGKTPQALKMHERRENSRDNIDRHYMEKFIDEVMSRFANLIVKNQKSSTTLRMFRPEIESLAMQYPEIEEMYNPETNELKIDSKHYNQTLYDYETISGSTYMVDRETTQKSLESLLNMISTQPQLIEALKAEGKEINLSELLTQIISNSGLQNWEKILTDYNPNANKNIDDVIAKNSQEFANFMQQMGAGNPNEVPPSPQGAPPEGVAPQVAQGGMR